MWTNFDVDKFFCSIAKYKIQNLFFVCQQFKKSFNKQLFEFLQEPYEIFFVED
jgi:hypothetical protein